MRKKMTVAVLAVASLFLLLRSTGFVMRRVLPFEKRPAAHEASATAAFFRAIGFPYRWPSSEVERIRQLLFADQPLEEIAFPTNVSAAQVNAVNLAKQQKYEWADEAASRLPNPDSDPWALLFRAYLKKQLGQTDMARELLRKLAYRDDVEVRLRLWAFKALRDLGEAPRSEVADELLGLVVEVEVDGGLDSLAVYPDGQARLVLHNGHITFYDPQDKRLLERIAALGPLAKAVYLKVPLGEPSNARPDGFFVRFTFLTPAGLRSAVASKKELSTPDYFALYTASAEVLKGFGELG